MAHVAKYSASACGGMCAHYERAAEIKRGYRRPNIDPERTGLNYNLAPDRGMTQVEFIQERIGSLDLKRAPRKDAVRMCDCVVTLPESFDATRSREFFEAAYSFLSKRYGEENVISAWVHMDEKTPHMHFAWVPVTPDGRLSAKSVVTRNDLMRLHPEMQESMERALGCPCEILLDDAKQGEKQLSRLSQSEYVAAKERLECLRREERVIEREVENMEPIAKGIGESIRTVVEHRGDGERQRAAEEENRQLRSRVRELEQAREDAKGRVRGLRERLGVLTAQVEELASKVRSVGNLVLTGGDRWLHVLASLGIEFEATTYSKDALPSSGVYRNPREDAQRATRMAREMRRR